MDEVLKANVFFFVTGVAVILFTLLLSIAVYHVIKALRTLRRILDRVEEGTEVIAEDLENIRDYFSQEGLLPRLLSTLMGTKRKPKRPAKGDRKRSDLKISEE